MKDAEKHAHFWKEIIRDTGEECEKRPKTDEKPLKAVKSGIRDHKETIERLRKYREKSPERRKRFAGKLLHILLHIADKTVKICSKNVDFRRRTSNKAAQRLHKYR